MEYIKRQTSLSANIVAFCRFLRHKGFTIGPQEEADALKALEVLDAFQSSGTLQLCLKATLARTRPQQLIFDELFFQYWRELEKAVNSKKKDGAPEQKRSQVNQNGISIKNWLQGNTQANDQEKLASYSRQESMYHKDFSAFAEDDLWMLSQHIRRIARTLALQQSRRKKASNKYSQLDLRRTLRQNMRRGGELLELAHHRKQLHKNKLVLLCDVSKSMDLYSRFLLQFIFSFQNAYRRIETFVFSTQLHRVTTQLHHQEFEEALKDLAASVPAWSGGTNIGASLHTFSKEYAAKLLNKRTNIIILSDGWDTGSTELIADSMKKMQTKAARIIWLNPLAGNKNYRPETQGMKAALPYIDVLAPVHNVESLKKLYQYLSK